MDYKVVTASKTVQDIENAILWYLDIDKKLASKFLTQLKLSKDYLTENSKKIQIRYSNVRIAYLKKFPYGFHYTLKDETVTIIALFSTSENPKKWNR
ncbi:MAG: hypothetical protein ACI8Q1_001785 [Parvicella sp.]|jgi:hypothetical protein